MKTVRKKLRKNYTKTIAKGFEIHTYQRWNEKKQKWIEYRSRYDMLFDKDDYSSKRTAKDSQRRLCKKLGTKRARKLINLYPKHGDIYLLLGIKKNYSDRNLIFDIEKLDEIFAMFDNNKIDFTKLQLSWRCRNILPHIKKIDGVYQPKNTYELAVLIERNRFNIDFSLIYKVIEYKNHKYYPIDNYELMALCLNESIDLKDIDISKTISLDWAFYCSDRKDFSEINKWDTSHIKSMKGMFECCENFNEKLSFDTSSVEDFSYMFFGCKNLNQEIEFDTSKAKKFNSMFGKCKSFNKKLSFNTSNAEEFSYMFYECSNFNQKIDFDFSKAKDIEGMFKACDNFNQSININTNTLERAGWLFAECYEYNQDFYLNSDNELIAHNIFRNCKNLNSNIKINSSKEIIGDDMFKACKKLKNISIQTNEIKAN